MAICKDFLPSNHPFHKNFKNAKEKQVDQNCWFKEQLKLFSLGLTFTCPDSTWHGERVHKTLYNMGRTIFSGQISPCRIAAKNPDWCLDYWNLKIIHFSASNQISLCTSRTTYLLPSLLITVKYWSVGIVCRYLKEERNYTWKSQNAETGGVLLL